MISLKMIKIIKFITNNPYSTLFDVASHFENTPQQIRKDINKINSVISKDNRIEIKNSYIKSKIDYKTFTDFTKTININEYVSSIQERIDLIIVLSYFHNYLSLTKLYKNLGISLTTKKMIVKNLNFFYSNINCNYLEKKDWEFE
ncbi:hypothetical protein SAMN04488558_102185 [Ignavigranum ruoffiae]|uniref:HTH domain-containing protein n=1 Tax=Ignavigranum ruoffiae TaxID=89093 RepID=A0A1H9B7S1_9LACT|nr:hypothetical protein SAMN04488558_102185 [Ignavigranum ruoffiae]